MERLRRTMMFVPGANAAMLRDAPLYGADSIMFDLEDAVSLKEKDSARVLVHSALKTFDYGNIEIVVRINWHRVRRRRLCYQYENTAPSRWPRTILCS